MEHADETQQQAPSDGVPPSDPANAPTLAPRAADLGGAEQAAAVRRFGDYEILEEVARGGMGVIYKARQISLNRLVALKMILAGQWAGPEARQRFRAEAEAAANLQHPNIVAIHEVGKRDGQQYFTMDFVAGTNLAALVRDHPLPAERAAAYVKTIAEAVHFAHQHGILHRDLKPQNVLIDTDDRPRVTDFGLAKRIETESGLTRTGDVLGSPSYIPPEQASSRLDEISPRSDVYSLGAILYELITGRAPFSGGTALETLCQVIDSPPPAPRKLNPSVPRDLETICLKCLEKSPSQRFQSVQELADELARFLNGERILSSPRRLESANTWIWMGCGVSVGAVASIVLRVMGWPPQSLFAGPLANGAIGIVYQVLGGCLLGALVASAAVLVWNTIVLPAWLLRSTTAPLAKVSLGLWLIFNGLLLAAISMGSLMVSALMETGSQTAFVRTMAAVVSKLWTVATLFTVIGPILCLEFGAKSRSTWLLLATVVFQVSALVFGIRGESNSFEAGFASLLMCICAAVLRIPSELGPHSGTAGARTENSLTSEGPDQLGRNVSGSRIPSLLRLSSALRRGTRGHEPTDLRNPDAAVPSFSLPSFSWSDPRVPMGNRETCVIQNSGKPSATKSSTDRLFGLLRQAASRALAG